MATPIWTRIVAVVGLLSVLASACGGDDRPSVEAWVPGWNRIVEAIPTSEELGNPPERAVCSTALGVVRSESGDLFPTPDLVIDDVVADWIRIAEDLLFECPPASQRVPSLEYAYGELARLEAEIAAVLAIDTENL
jgi:hypothetical protein